MAARWERRPTESWCGLAHWAIKQGSFLAWSCIALTLPPLYPYLTIIPTYPISIRYVWVVFTLMVRKLMVRQGYRFYAAVLVLWAAFIGFWGLSSIPLSPETIGYGWLAVAVIGVPISIGLYATRDSIFTGRQETMDRFTDHTLSGWPLGIYTASIVVWSAVFVAWMNGSIALSPGILAGGWFAIAAYGAVLTVGLISLHRQEVMEAINLRTVDRDSL